jgi:hypothetical protein
MQVGQDYGNSCKRNIGDKRGRDENCDPNVNLFAGNKKLKYAADWNGVESVMEGAVAEIQPRRTQ